MRYNAGIPFWAYVFGQNVTEIIFTDLWPIFIFFSLISFNCFKTLAITKPGVLLERGDLIQ